MFTRLFFYLVFIQVFFAAGLINAQEINCRLRISAPGLSDQDKRILETLSSDLEEFINQNIWTEYRFEPNERIEASMQITIDEKEGNDKYKGSIQVQSGRPIYNTNYSSRLLNINDRDLEFTYRENEPLEYSDNRFSNNLTSVIAFYVYIIIGFDFDSYKELGGTPFFERAQNVVNTAQGQSKSGWQSQDGQRNRYWLVENLFNSQYEPIRKAIYKYHRHGFDKMVDDTNEATKNVTEALELMKKAHRQRPGSYLMQIVMNAKNNELVNLYSEAPTTERANAKNILTEIDPSNASQYRKITQ